MRALSARAFGGTRPIVALRSAFGGIEAMVAMAILGVVFAVVWSAFSLGSRQNADADALLEVLRAELLVESLLIADLDRVASPPEGVPVSVSDDGRKLALLVARTPPDGSYARVDADPVHWEIRGTGPFQLVRDGRPLPGVQLAAAHFDVVPLDRGLLVTARLVLRGAPASWRENRPPPGAVHELARVIGTPDDVPRLAPRIVPSGALAP